MLDNETKRRIDTARDILVGKIPDPKSQVEQITIALIYKFMDDMDKESVEFGGTATFFTGDYQKYSWTSLLDSKLGGQEVLALYGEAIVKLNQNPNLPQLFRDIFKNAYLPYRDAETLKLFLKTINGFTYDHSERLGDAFEYLLSVLGSQGDAGQFRTPRHIIDFIVAAVQPKKDETICDPACGTAGFLISSYKYILAQNTGRQLGDTLSPADRKALMHNFTGYDISPDMVRLSLVNMYLHHFTLPQVHEYDTLTSEDRWGDTFDIILANPPFMTPKGGIKPHKKFSMHANRSEVLFADYIAEHINPVTGRAGVIVPEGIIFQSATAYKALRKLLVEKQFLYAVISLPAGVFQPYSGVKTSVLLMDKTVAKKSNEILFVKIDNDGFDLGAQRRANTKTELPDALNAVLAYKDAVLGDKPFVNRYNNVLVVPKEQIKGVGDYNLSGERYRVTAIKQSKWEMVRLGDVCKVKGGKRIPKGMNFSNRKTSHPYLRVSDFTKSTINYKELKYIEDDVFNEIKNYTISKNDVYLTIAGTIGLFGIIPRKLDGANLTENAAKLVFNKLHVNKSYLAFIGASEAVQVQIKKLTHAVGVPKLALERIKTIIFPLPPLSIQQEIVAKIEGYQRIIDGARQVVENYKTQIDIDESWDMVALGEVCEKITDGSHFSPSTQDFGYPYITVKDIVGDEIDFNDCKFINQENYTLLCKSGCKPLKDDILFSKDGTVGKVSLINFEKEFVVLSSLAIVRPKQEIINPTFLKIVFQSDYFFNKAVENKTGVAIKRIVLKTLKEILVPLPPLSIQQQIVQGIEKEQQLVNANKELITLYQQKIKAEIAKLWVAEKEEKVYEMKEEALSVVAEVSDIL